MKNSNILKKMISAFAVALCVTLLTPGVAQAKSQVALNKAKVTVCTGKTYTLKMSGISKKVKWSTSDKNVVSITKKSGKKSEKVTINGVNKGTATVTAKVKVGKKTKTFKCKVTVKGHSYSKPSYAWNKDFSKCTATKECTRCHKKLTQTVKTSKKTTTKATCTEKGKRTHTAKFTKYDFGTKKKNVSIKALGHAFDKVSYKWNASYSACTAKAVCSRCNASVSEKATVTSKVTKQATKSATGVRTYTATFTNKGFATQTKNVTIPKVAYLDQTSVSVRSDRPMTVKVVNDTIASVSSSNGKIKYTNDTQSVTIKTTDKLGDAKGVVSITTTGGTVLKCDVVTEFMPGTEYVGQNSISHTYARDEAPYRYCAYGDLKNTWTNYDYSYKVKCQKRAEYNAAEYFYTHQTLRDGSVGNLVQKAQETYYACSERSLYYNQYMDALIAQYGSVGQIYASCDDELYNYLILTSADSTGFNGIVESQSQVDFIVTAWANKYNNGEMPSWYYPTVFSDWAVWSGADVGLNTESYYEFRGIN